MKMRKKMVYSYLLCYGFSKKVYSEQAGETIEYTEGGTGRVCLDLDKKIESPDDIQNVERLIIDALKDAVENLESVALYSFSLMRTAKMLDTK